MTAPYYWLLPSVTTSLIGDDLVVILDSGFLRFNKFGRAALELIERIDGSLSDADVDPAQRELIDLLDAEGWIVRLDRPLSALLASCPRKTRQLSYYAHLQPHYPDRALAELASKRVAVVGVGGVGSHVAQGLAGAGVHELVLLDPDTVDESNLNRQFMYTLDDVGKPKATCAAEHLRRRFPDVRVTHAIAAWTDETPKLELLQGVDLIVFAGDSPTINRAAAGGIGTTPFVCGGYMGAKGIVGPLVWPAHGSACWQCTLDGLNNQDVVEAIFAGAVARATAWNPSGAQVNGIVGNLLSEVAVRALAPSLGVSNILRERLVIDMATLSITRESVAARTCEHVEEAA